MEEALVVHRRHHEQKWPVLLPIFPQTTSPPVNR